MKPIMKSLSGLFILLLSLNAFAQTTFPLEYLVPTPHTMECHGEARFTGTSFQLQNALLPPESVAYLNDDMQKWFGLTPAPDGQIQFIIEKIAPQDNREYHELTLTDNRITIRAATADGAQRGLGRLFGIVEQLSAFPVNHTLTLPALAIKDAPDFPWRGMHFQYGGEWAPFRLNYLRNTIDLLNRLGFNYVMFEIGGRVQCDAFPEITRQPAWPAEALEELLAFAKARGFRVYPAVNGPGHMKAGPRIYPMAGKRDSGEWSEELIMDITKPDFYEKWFAYLDCVHEAFHNPEYFSIGSDEHHYGRKMFEETTGRSLTDTYVEFLTKTTEHLKQRGAKTCAWHDMMVDAKTFGPQWTDTGEREPANASVTILDRIPKDLTVMYWYYGNGDNHPVFDALRQTPNELWSAVWRNVEGTYKIFRKARAAGLTHALPCIWGMPLYQLVIPACADAMWHLDNPLHKDKAYFEACNTRLFWQPLPSATPVKEFGQTVLADQLPQEFPLPWNPETILKQGKVLFTVDGTYELLQCNQLHHNTARMTEGIWFYTPTYGPSTKTNRWGDELVVIDGTITAVSRRLSADKTVPEGNLPIPANGLVLSLRGIFPKHFHPANWLQPALKPGKKILLYQVPQNPPPLKPYSYDFPEGINAFRANLLLPRQFLRDAPIARLRVTLQDGSQQEIRLKGLNFLTPPTLPAGWHSGSLHSVPEPPLLEIAFTAPDNAAIKNLTILPEANAAYAKLTLTKLALFPTAQP